MVIDTYKVKEIQQNKAVLQLTYNDCVNRTKTAEFVFSKCFSKLTTYSFFGYGQFKPKEVFLLFSDKSLPNNKWNYVNKLKDIYKTFGKDIKIYNLDAILSIDETTKEQFPLY